MNVPRSKSEARDRQRQGAPPRRSNPVTLPAVAPELVAVQLVDGRTAAAVGDMSLSWWHEMVLKRVAPQPAFRAPRCTRWRLIDVVAFWGNFRPSEAAAVGCVEQAVKASARALEQRRAAAAKVEG